jgi:AcrR family transcriptional regulator
MAADTRQRIVEEALRLFGRNGYVGTSVADIERAAGLKPGAGGLYAHFESKKDLLAAAIEQSVATARVDSFVQATLPAGDLRSEVTVIVLGSLLMLDSAEELLRMLLKEGEQFPELFDDARKRVLAPAYRYMADWLASKASAAALAEHDSEAVADMVLGAISNYWFQTRLFDWQPNDVDEQRFIAAAVDFVLRLTPRPPSAGARRRKAP